MKKIVLIVFLIFAKSTLAANETAIEIIPLAPPLDQADAEISGLTWCDNKLIILPQYPARLSDSKQSFFYYLLKSQITDFLDGEVKKPLKAKKILVNEKDLRKAVTIFDGFEAIACNDDKVWLSIEAINLIGSYQSFVVPGTIHFGETASIELDQTRLVKLETLSNMRNIGDEAIFVKGNDVIALHEVNDARIVSRPKARRVNAQDSQLSLLTFPNLPYRITDATALDSKNRFWAINYKYSGDKFSRNATDGIATDYGQSDSHKKYYNVERLIELQLNDDGIELVKRAPLQLKMDDVEGRNWEGLVRLNTRGFLLATDKHPRTILAFLPTKP